MSVLRAIFSNLLSSLDLGVNYVGSYFSTMLKKVKTQQRFILCAVFLVYASSAIIRTLIKHYPNSRWCDGLFIVFSISETNLLVQQDPFKAVLFCGCCFN